MALTLKPGVRHPHPPALRPPPSRHERFRHRKSTRLALRAVTLAFAALLGIGSPNPANAVGPGPGPAVIDAGFEHTCAVLEGDTVVCWGLNTSGQLGYGNSFVAGSARIGDNEPPASAGAVDFGGPTAVAVAAGGYHSCAILSDRGVRCWGLNTSGQLGYAVVGGAYDAVGDDEILDMFVNVDLGANRTAKAISVGGAHTCVILDNGKVRCWGDGGSGQLGYGGTDDIGDDETPASASYVALGNGRTAKKIAAGGVHTCVILDNDKVRCWGFGLSGQLGYGNENAIGDDVGETPASAGYVDLGSGGITAKHIAAGSAHTCVILSNNKVRCWGDGGNGRLGYGSTEDIGDDETPNTATVGHVDLGGLDAIEITAGLDHTCAIVSGITTSTYCWGSSGFGKLGLPDATETDTPGFVDLLGRPERVAITAGSLHTCAAFSDGGVLCWGNGQEGALGRGNTRDIGDDETPGSVSDDIELGDPVRIP